MSGRGEQPATADGDDDAERRADAVGLGTTVYDEQGKALGSVRGVEAGGFFVSTRSGVERRSIEHARSGHDFGEAHLMWRCTDCGEMGRIDEGVPETCPACGTPKEYLMWWTED